MTIRNQTGVNNQQSKNKNNLTLNDSDHEGLHPGRSGSGVTGSRPFLDSIKTQSIILMIKGGGFPSRRTVAISADLIVCKLKKMTFKNMTLYIVDVFVVYTCAIHYTTQPGMKNIRDQAGTQRRFNVI